MPVLELVFSAFASSPLPLEFLRLGFSATLGAGIAAALRSAHATVTIFFVASFQDGLPLFVFLHRVEVKREGLAHGLGGGALPLITEIQGGQLPDRICVPFEHWIVEGSVG